MPRVKFDYIVSFSDEDPENQASNLLALEVSKKKWLCSKGEPSCSVVLQLVQSVKINAVHIGAYHSALVEVLVGRSEKPNEPFQVLVPSSVFVSPPESRRGEGVERVRMFSAEQLSDCRDGRWDRVRVVCSQPYNKHCKYGLSFIQIYEPEGKDPALKPLEMVSQPKPAVPSRMLPIETFSSDEDEFKPGELFAMHRHKISEGSVGTDAQIRKATSQALKNISDSSTKLLKTPINKPRATNQSPTQGQSSNRQRNSLMYTDDDEQPHAKIDHIVNRHNSDKTKAKTVEEDRKKMDNKSKDKHSKVNDNKNDESKHRRYDDHTKDDPKHKRHNDHSKDDTKHRRDSSHSKKGEGSKRTQSSQDSPSTSHAKGKDRDSRKRTHSSDRPVVKNKLRAGRVSDTPHTLFRGVVFVMSGYENPRRASIRDSALAMGARFERDWGPTCTHLVCAFPNTPKLKTVRSSPNGKTAVVAMAEWVEQCCQRRRMLPWQWFATEPKLRIEADIDLEASTPSPRKESDDDGGNTDEEIERAIQKEKRRRTDSTPHDEPRTSDIAKQRKQRSPSAQEEKNNNDSTDSDVAFVRDERVKGNITIEDSDSDSTVSYTSDRTCIVKEDKVLPDFFDGYTFAIDEAVDEKMQRSLLSRYVKAYGGVVVEPAQMDEETGVDFFLCGDLGEVSGSKDRHKQIVRTDWIWRCHEDLRLYPIEEYMLT